MNRNWISAKKIVAVILAAAILLLGYYLLRPGYLVVNASPSDSKVMIDGKVTAANKPVRLSPGHKKITVERTGFIAKQYDATVQRGKKSNLEATLLIDTNYLNSGGQLNLPQNENLTPPQVDDLETQIANRTPIIGILPYTGPDFEISSGVPQKNPNSVSQAIYIVASTDAQKQAALKWIQDQGYDPSTLEIIYQPPR